jgi:methionine-S-sulfoxide reductase
MDTTATTPRANETATFAGGCFWCMQPPFDALPGVRSTTVGYTGGTKDNPTYEEVCSGTTGHAESIQVFYDPTVVSYEKLLDVFWRQINPTTPNRQFADVGTPYRSAIFYQSDAQKQLAERSKAALGQSGRFNEPIVTEIVPYDRFWKAEDYHQDYFAKNPDVGYCRAVVGPKVAKFEKVFKDRLKRGRGGP